MTTAHSLSLSQPNVAPLPHLLTTSSLNLPMVTLTSLTHIVSLLSPVAHRPSFLGACCPSYLPSGTTSISLLDLPIVADPLIPDDVMQGTARAQWPSLP